MTTGLFITGTDTGIGKTTIALALITALQKDGLKVGAMKPVSAGCTITEDGLRNEDAEQLMQRASVDFPYDIVNPYAFEPAIAPHIAADEAGIKIDKDLIKDRYQQIANSADIVIIEGAGGWLVPINASETMADIAKFLSLDVLTVVGIRLGCLNHALLTASVIEDSGLKHMGWIANCVNESTLRISENILTLERRISAPLMDEVKYSKKELPDLANTVKVIKRITGI